jgi:putative addiction module killer protein
VTEVRQTEVFADWLAALRDRRGAQRIRDRILRIAGGLSGDVEPVGEGVSEARVHWGPGYRLYFVRKGEALIILLCGGDKSSQSRDIARAKRLAKEV